MIHAGSKYNEMSLEELDRHIPEEEPVFLLRGQDKYAPDTIRKWLKLLKTDCPDSSLIPEVKNHLEQIIYWQMNVRCKVPD